MRELLQRALRTFGSPFKTRRARNPERSAEETLESQTGPFQSETKEVVQVTSAAQDNAGRLNSTGILPEEPILPKIRIPPTGSTGPVSENVQNPHQAEPDGPQLTEGASRVVTAKDGAKDCLALLLTKELVAEFNQMIDQGRTLEAARQKLDEVTNNATIAELEGEELSQRIEITDDPELQRELTKKIEIQAQIYVDNSERKESLRQAVGIRRRNFEYTQELFHEIFRRALEETDLLTPPSAEVDSRSPSRTVRSRQDSVASVKMDESNISASELFRNATHEDLERKRQAVQELQIAFDNRQDDYERELEQFERAVANGKTNCTRSLFDRLALETVQDITRALINAEADQESALGRAKALGLDINVADQESNFISDISDGYRESQEASMNAALDRKFIQTWSATIVSSQPMELDEHQEPDEWDAKTVGISDSISLVDFTRNRKRIDRWREMCGH